ncbi:MAG: FlgO family outer membrane protein [Campylobacterota bacterium]
MSFITLFLASCTISQYKNPLDGANNFDSLVSSLVNESSKKINNIITQEQVILVSDFVNIDDLKNRSQLGFLLSNMLKDKLVSSSIIVKEIEFGKDFTLGRSGFNVLIRDSSKVLSNTIKKSKYAVVGTYSISTKSLNVFIKLIDIETGNILASSHKRTAIDKEILSLEGKEEDEIILRPNLTL